METVTTKRRRKGPALSERDLYRPLARWLEKKRNLEDGTIDVIALDTSHAQLSGKWQNPDVTEIAIESLPHLRVRRIVVNTWEVKRWGHWDQAAPFEAASHARFAHYSYVALEHPKGRKVTQGQEDAFKAIERECERLDIGLAKISRDPLKEPLGLRLLRPASPSRSDDTDVEEFLATLFKRDKAAKAKFDAMVVKSWGQ
jgi:hypothetical protein